MVNIGHIREDKAEFQQLLERFITELQPVGILEALSVERVAVAVWRLRRAIRAEAGRLSEDRQDAQRTAWTNEVSANDEALDGVIRQMQHELTDDYGVSEDTLARLREVTLADGTPPTELEQLAGTVNAQVLAIATATEPAPQQAAIDARTRAVEALRQQLKTQEAALDETGRAGRAAVRIARAVSAIPGPAAVAALTRYETMRNRELDRALAQLAEQQRRRTATRSGPRADVANQIQRAG